MAASCHVCDLQGRIVAAATKMRDVCVTHRAADNTPDMELEDNIARVRKRIAAACRRAGRQPESIKLVAVSKTVPSALIRRAYEAGVRDFGENRAQEAVDKRGALSDLAAVWHLIGHLQTNKAKSARELFHWVQTVDSVRVAQKLDQAALSREDRLPVLIQVRLGDEPTKSGVQESEVLRLAEQVSTLSTLELRGLMVLPPYFEDTEQVRPFFRRLRELARTLESARLPNVAMQELSMGMSHDFEVAIEEGATMVRVGTAIFGERD
jgi:pyridoxal phosphate enzyme (YggS family)